MAGRGLINVFGVSEKPQIVTWKYGTNQNLTAMFVQILFVRSKISQPYTFTSVLLINLTPH
jgi:hypothetical protein